MAGPEHFSPSRLPAMSDPVRVDPSHSIVFARTVGIRRVLVLAARSGKGSLHEGHNGRQALARELIFMPLIRSYSRREAAEDRRAIAERQTTARWSVSGGCRTGEKDFCQEMWERTRFVSGNLDEILYCGWIRMEAGEWVQARW